MKVIIIGRGQKNDILIDDDQVSHNHLQIVQDNYGNCSAVDLGSTNGTFVNGQRIKSEVRLQANDVVRIGNTVLPWQSYFNQTFPFSGNNPESNPISKRTIWYIATVVAFVLLVSGSIIVTKVFYIKKQEKTEAENRAKIERLQQETKQKEAETKRLQDEADELLRKALVSQRDKEKSHAEQSQQIANIAKGEAAKAKAEMEKAKTEQQKTEKKLNDKIVDLQKQLKGTQKEIKTKNKNDSEDVIPVKQSVQVAKPELTIKAETETLSQDKQANRSKMENTNESDNDPISNAHKAMEDNYHRLTYYFKEKDFKNVCDQLGYNSKNAKSAKQVLDDKFEAASRINELQKIIRKINEYCKENNISILQTDTTKKQ